MKLHGLVPSFSLNNPLNAFDNVNWVDYRVRADALSEDGLEQIHKMNHRSYRRQWIRDYVINHTLGNLWYLWERTDLFEEEMAEIIKDKLAAVEDGSFCCCCGDYVVTFKTDEDVDSDDLDLAKGLFPEMVSLDVASVTCPVKFCGNCIEEIGPNLDRDIRDGETLEAESFKQMRPQIAPVLEQYVATKDKDFSSNINLFRLAGLSKYVLSDNLHELNTLGLMFALGETTTNAAGEKLSQVTNNGLNEGDFSSAFITEFSNDLKLLKKLFEKNGLSPNYRQILLGLFEIELEREDGDVLKSIFAAVRKKADNVGSQESVLNTLFRLPIRRSYPTEEWSQGVVRMVLGDLNLAWTSDTEKIIDSILEETEVEDFERSLEAKVEHETKALPAYHDLDGYEFEEWLIGFFQRLGFRTAGTRKSRDQGADLVLQKSGLTYVVQAKKHTAAVTNSAVQQVVASKAIYGADKAIVVSTSSFTDAALELAVANGVELWDGDRLNATLAEINEKGANSGKWTARVSWNDENGLCRGATSCFICGAEIEYEMYVLSRESEVRYVCSLCGGIAEGKVDLTRQFTCEQCGNVADTLEDFKRHKSSGCELAGE
jgi:hypothetical protein